MQTKKKKKTLSPASKGLTPEDKKVLEQFQRKMDDVVIPEIVKIVEERRILAAKSRHWQLKC